MSTRPLSPRAVASFRKTVWVHYKKHGRALPWRPPELALLPDGAAREPYAVLVSEIMLQQTQVDRVIPKYKLFMGRFPSVYALARAPLRDVLEVWSGLGYNRRAKFLHELAKTVVKKYRGHIPQDEKDLRTLPGIGAATAASFAAFAFNHPAIFIETNIRSVFIHHFFKNRNAVRDKDIIPLVRQTVDVANPREWYYALMDYGVMLKETHPNPSRKSAHHAKQSPFKGSRREIRGKILALLVHSKRASTGDIRKSLKCSAALARSILKDLESEGFIKKRRSVISVR